jgi:hypothetical protein
VAGSKAAAGTADNRLTVSLPVCVPYPSMASSLAPVDETLACKFYYER